MKRIIPYLFCLFMAFLILGGSGLVEASSKAGTMSTDSIVRMIESSKGVNGPNQNQAFYETDAGSPGLPEAGKHPAFRKVRTVKLTVLEDLGKAKNTHLRATIFAERWLKIAGINVTTDPGAPCDGELTFTVHGTPLGADYFPGGFHYTAASIYGRIDFKVPGKTITQKYNGRILPPQTITVISGVENTSTPDDAPFEKAASVKFSLYHMLTKVMVEAFGKDIIYETLLDEERIPGSTWALAEVAKRDAKKLVTYLQREEWKDRWLILWAFGEARDKKQIPVLMNYISDSTNIWTCPSDVDISPMSVGVVAMTALEKITHREYGCNVNAWKDWWAKQ